MRDRQFNIVAGFPGHGKSTLVADAIDRHPDKNALIYLEEVDLDSDAFLRFPLVDFWDYRGGKVRINAETVDYLTFLQFVAKYFRNGILCVDEGGLHERYKLSKEMYRVVATRRKIGVDVFINYHGLTRLPIDQFDQVNNIILFHTTDKIKRKRDSIPKYEELLALQAHIAQEVLKGGKYKYTNGIIQLAA